MRIFTILLFFSFSFYGFTQNSYSKEFSLQSDNDLYTSIYRDRYYTNGLFLTFRTVAESDTTNLIKKIHQFQVGHMMFTPFKATLQFSSSHDRPFAGYLYGAYSLNRFYKSQNMFSTEIQLGVIGPRAKSQELQNFMHSIYNYPEATGWKYQIQNAMAVNLNAKYLKYFPKVSSSIFDVSSYNSLKIGTIFTSLSTGIYSRIGLKKLQKFSNSVAFNSNINKTSQSFSESFIFIKPMLTYAFYDATIQGSFLNETSPVTFSINSLYFSLKLGYRFYKNRFQYGYTYYFHTKKLKSVRVTKTNTYGSIYIGYYFN